MNLFFHNQRAYSSVWLGLHFLYYTNDVLIFYLFWLLDGFVTNNQLYWTWIKFDFFFNIFIGKIVLTRNMIYPAMTGQFVKWLKITLLRVRGKSECLFIRSTTCFLVLSSGSALRCSMNICSQHICWAQPTWTRVSVWACERVRVWTALSYHIT